VRRAYTACATLRDRGIATSTSIRQSGARDTDKQRFAIDFVRPDRFRVETAKMTVGPEDEWFSWWILRDGERVLLSSGSYSKDPVSPDEFVARLGRLLVIPGLLVPCPAELDPLPTNDTAALLGLMTLGAQECHVVRGTCAAGFERTLWVDTVGLVRRCDEVFHVDEAWRERMRTRTEEKLRLATPEQATEIRRSLEFFSRPSEPYSTETTVLFDPEPDAAIEAARFAVPDSRTR